VLAQVGDGFTGRNGSAAKGEAPEEVICASDAIIIVLLDIMLIIGVI